MYESSIFSAKTLFSLASRKICAEKFKKLPVLNSNPIPTATSAVLVPLSVVDDAVSLIYTVRTSLLHNTNGHVAFPGGKSRMGETPEQTALRETYEEIGVEESKFEIWGKGPAIPETDNKTLITPVIGSIEELYPAKLNPNYNEVCQVFAVALQVLCKAENQFYTQSKSGRVMPVFTIDHFKIWGSTAYITHGLLGALLPKEVYSNEYPQEENTIARYCGRHFGCFINTYKQQRKGT